MVNEPVDSHRDDSAQERGRAPQGRPYLHWQPVTINALRIVIDRHGQTELDEETDESKAEDDEFHSRRPDSSYGVSMECQPILLPFKIDVTPYHIRVSLSGLENIADFPAILQCVMQDASLDASLCSELLSVIEAWPTLPAATRAKIIKLTDAQQRRR